MKLYGLINLVGLILLNGYVSTLISEDASFWRNQALSDLKKSLENTPNTKIAKNVILFVGDGMGISTFMAARVWKGQRHGNTGEETVLEFEKFPYVGLAKIYSTNKQVPDSGSTATAMLTGVKTKSKLLGLDNSATVGICRNITTARVSTMLEWAQKAGKSTGIVTTTRITHATPAAAYAHTPHRDWENAYSVPVSQSACKDIAYQLVKEHDIQVILGGGRKQFRTVTMSDPIGGQYSLNLLQEWMDDKMLRKKKHAIVSNSEQLYAVDTAKTEYLLGLFSDDHMDYEIDRDTSLEGEPGLGDMTRKAIQILQNNHNGFFLLVEGGRIDHAHHSNKAKKALHDTLAFETAVKVATELTDEKDTLIIVTADHSHVMTVAGYPDRGNGILDIVRTDGSPSFASDHLPYTTLSYANGKSYTYLRRDLTHFDTEANEFQQTSAVPMGYETHSGEDVAVFSRGPMAHLLTGVKEQNFIAYVMAHAACIGPTDIPCDTGRDSNAQERGERDTIPKDKSAPSTNDRQKISNQNPTNGLSRVKLDPFLFSMLTFISYRFLVRHIFITVI